MAATLDKSATFALGDALPSAWHWLYFHDVVAASQLGEDGHPALGVTLPPIPLPRRMWAAGSLTFEDALVLGATASRTSTIRSVTPRDGRSGPLYFVTIGHDVLVDGRLCVREEQVIVYRGPAREPSSEESPSVPRSVDFGRSWEIDSAALFRYSALTFNGHRIHYDVEYARQVEGYQGLVVHGPLLATLLIDLAVEQSGQLASFDFRARAPLFAPSTVRTSGRVSPSGVDLWAGAADGRLAMAAAATFKKGSS